MEASNAPENIPIIFEDPTTGIYERILQGRGEIDNGLKEGLWSAYYPSGMLAGRGHYESNQKNGRWETFINGNTKIYADYANGKLEGPYKSFYPKGYSLMTNQIFANGIANGLYTGHYDNGSKKAEGDYIDDVKQGLWIYWYSDGQKKAEGNYVNGFKNGQWILFDRNPSRSRIVNYDMVADTY